MRLMFSGRDFAWLYGHCDQVSFLDGHVRAFSHFGGVPRRGVYDNLTPAVRRVLLPGRALTERFQALVSHYLFEPCFAHVGVGHDKGGVEARGKGIRLQHLVPIPRGDSLETVGKDLLSALDAQALRKRDIQGHTVMDKFSQESLRALPSQAFEPRLVATLTVSRKSLVVYKGGTYSLPSHWRSLDVTAYVGPTDIRFVCRNEVQVRARVARHDKNIRYRDYLDELSRNPKRSGRSRPSFFLSSASHSKSCGSFWRIRTADAKRVASWRA